MNWTQDLPTESGFYWYWEEESSPIVVEFDLEMGWIYSCGNEIAQGADLTYKITGYFWPEKLTSPPYKPQ